MLEEPTLGPSPPNRSKCESQKRLSSFENCGEDARAPEGSLCEPHFMLFINSRHMGRRCLQPADLGVPSNQSSQDWRGQATEK